MTTKFYIKTNDSAEPLQVLMKKVTTTTDGTTPPTNYWLTSRSISQVYFSMAKIPQTLDNGDVLYPDGTIHKTDGTILNPLGNPNVVISSINLQPGEILYEDYSVLQTDGSIRYPNGLIKDVTGVYSVPNHSILLPNGMIKFPANMSYPQGFIYNPGDIDRTNYYKVGNPTEVHPNPDATINLPDGCTLDATFSLIMPNKVIPIPSGSTILSTTTIKFPAGTTKEVSVQINRDNALILPQVTEYHPSIYTLSYNSNTKIYTFPVGSDLEYNNLNQTARIIFPNFAVMAVPYSTVKHTTNTYTFPVNTEYFYAEAKFNFPGETITLPLSATINIFGLNISVTFPTGTVIDPVTQTITLIESNYLVTDGVTHLYDSSTITLNDNHIILYNLYEFYPRGTQKNTFGTIIHPDGATPDLSQPSYLRYYPTQQNPTGFLIRPTDAAIVNNDGTYTKLDYSIVDDQGRVIQLPHTDIPLYQQTPTPPFIPTTTQSTYIVINHQTASYETISYPITTQTMGTATLLSYQWKSFETAHTGLYKGEFEVHYDNNTKRTFPIQKGDSLFIEILDHFNQ
jgi:hypothetical protein